MTGIPPQLCGDEPLFLKVHSPSANVSSPGKQPLGSTINGPFFRADELRDWIADGGNVGRALNDDLVALDVDDPALAAAADERLPPTFTVRTGNGEHRYYVCPDWETNRQLADVGSIRSDRYLVVVPPSTHPSGQQYTVLDNRSIAAALSDSLQALADDVASDSPSRASTVASRSCEALRRINHDDRRAEVLSILRDSNPGHHERVWLVGFLYCVVGMDVREIIDVIECHNRWADFDRATTRRQVESVVRTRGCSR